MLPGLQSVLERDRLVTDREKPTKELVGAVTPPSDLILDAQLLFQGRKEIVILHEGVRYRLRLTRRNKLILQK